MAFQPAGVSQVDQQKPSCSQLGFRSSRADSRAHSEWPANAIDEEVFQLTAKSAPDVFNFSTSVLRSSIVAGLRDSLCAELHRAKRHVFEEQRHRWERKRLEFDKPGRNSAHLLSVEFRGDLVPREAVSS
jgi:hypothetical protein